MTFTGWRKQLYNSLDWVMRLAYVNILWLGGILLGVGVAGVFPATVAMFTVVRSWLLDEDQEKAATLFWRTYKSEFWQGNAYGYIWVIIGLILYFDLTFFRSFNNLVSLIFTYVIFIVCAIYACSLLFAFPVYTHYDVPIAKMVKNSVLLTLSQPLYAIILAAAFYLSYYIVFRLPGLLPFFGGSLITLSVQYVSLNLFKNLANSKLKNN